MGVIVSGVEFVFGAAVEQIRSRELEEAEANATKHKNEGRLEEAARTAQEEHQGPATFLGCHKRRQSR